MNTNSPTPDSELNAVLHEFVTSVQAILGKNFISAYLQGSFAIGDWDNDSDVDFTIITEHDVSEVDLSALQAMHARIYKLGIFAYPPKKVYSGLEKPNFAVIFD